MHNKPLEMVTVAGLARELGLSPNGVRKILDRHDIVGDAVLAEGAARSELFLRGKIGLIKEIIDDK